MMGSEIHLHVRACGTDTIIIVQTLDLDGSINFPIGSEVSFTFTGNTAHVFSRETEKNLELKPDSVR